MHNLTDLQDKLLEFARSKVKNDDPSHDFSHILRVLKNCSKILEKEPGDFHILFPAAIFHDFVNLPKDHPERHLASKYSSEKAAEYLKKFNYSEEEISKITKCIIEHSYSANKAPSSQESKILQDADRLDALGAIGVLRCATISTKLCGFYYNCEDPFFRKGRPLDDKKYMVDHYQKKLFKLESNMQTKEGKRIARERTSFMRNFLSQLSAEI